MYAADYRGLSRIWRQDAVERLLVIEWNESQGLPEFLDDHTACVEGFWQRSLPEFLSVASRSVAKGLCYADNFACESW